MNCEVCGFPIMQGDGFTHPSCTKPEPTLFDETVDALRLHAQLGVGGNYRVCVDPERVSLDPPANATPTSQAAAVAIAPITVSILKRVHDFIKAKGSFGATDFEVCEALNLEGNTERPRRWTLVKQGLVKQKGVRKHGKHNAAVWVSK